MSMNTSSSGHSEVTNDINVTPFCDICLVLLIIFMVITPMLQNGVAVDIPKARNPQKEPERESDVNIAVQMTPQGRIETYYGKKGIAPDLLRERLEEAYTKDPGRQVYVKGHQAAEFGNIKAVLRDVQAAGFKDVGLVVQHVDAKGNPITGAQPEPEADK